MSAIALEANYGFDLPSSYVNINSEEMEYVEGGGVSTTWYGVQIRVSAGTCADLGAYLAGGAACAAGVAGILGLTGVAIPYAVGLTIGAIVMGIGSAYMWYCSNRNGFYYDFNYFWSDSWGRIN